MNIVAWSLILSAVLSAPRPRFSQGVDYRIEARLDEHTSVLTGRAELRYTNRAPRALDTLYFHLHLNAFRPNSAWSQRELQFDNRRFQDLGVDDYAFDRIGMITVNGRPARAVYPFMPDSTVLAVPLPASIRPNATIAVRIDWTSRLATIARRQGRRGRHYDWAHWYPRIAVFDTAGWQVQPLLPQGEFYGEFASYDVTLDVADDQVLAATGVPVSGDPGWEHANRTPGGPVLYRRDAYVQHDATALGLLQARAAGRKQVRWRAERVHHFAWAADPAFIYEGSHQGETALHVLYLPGDTLWPDRAMTTVKAALAFYTSVLGPYLYPQLTTSRRIDTGGTEFPMLTMHGQSPAIVHETGHEWAYAMLANNEFREGWLDEGLVTFLGYMYTEAANQPADIEPTMAAIARLDSAGASQPIATRAEEFRNFIMYQMMTYRKPALVLRMLRWYVGDADFRRGLKLYYEQNKLQHVGEADLRAAMEGATGRDLGWFFRQWLHTTSTLDYRIESASTIQLPTGAWRTRVNIGRDGEAWMPVDLMVGDTTVRVESHDRSTTAFVETAQKPDRAELDPAHVLIDVRRANNVHEID